ncbi:sterol-binding-like protein [Vitiosangium sp. GDMCC 1.1324]|uniref:sterol-binding-like protein n=1 Tax=Vitiosangium sp. (strain GDMCC 1.1324) TaxID=2138576 RepID=UPI000D362F3A|nr:sterol-binding-like protein [Vitiosangium sp. GDMCC 1.1324]PTL79792.1 sterol-binding-like protein [Vitiosangium sp. GDMCC 1.1324]
MATLLAESFSVLVREQPEAHVRMCAHLDGLAVAVMVDEEHFAAGFSLRSARVRPVTGHEPARVITRRCTLLEILDDRQSLTEAILADAVQVVGPLDTLLRLHEGLSLYVQGAVRCHGFAFLLRRLRESCVLGA